MNKKVMITLIACTFALTPAALFGSTFAAWAVTDEADPFGVRVIIASDVRTATFYTTYSGSAWGGVQEETVVKDAKLSSVPNVSLTGYTFKGWTEAIPSSTNYSATYSNSDILNLTISSNKSFYPILESNADYACADSNYYAVNTDVEINASSIGNTLIGKRYVGISGIPNATASWNSSRNLHSASGVYKFQDVDGGAMLYRKINFKPNNSWLGWWDGGIPCFGVYAWDEDDYSKNVSIHMGSGTTLTAYIPATYINFKFTRYSHNATSFQWGNESYNMKFDQSWYWSGENNYRYTKSSTYLTMNQWDNWKDGWGSESSKWLAS